MWTYSPEVSRMAQGTRARRSKNPVCERGRDFIERVAAYGGSVTAAMTALDLLSPAKASAALSLEGSGSGNATSSSSAAGVAGLCAAYELGQGRAMRARCSKHARVPAGGLWTVRNGDRHTESDGSVQRAAFPEGSYLNPGPARVPQHHVTMDYYREFGVAVEQFGNVNLNAYYHSTKAPPELQRVRARERPSSRCWDTRRNSWRKRSRKARSMRR